MTLEQLLTPLETTDATLLRIRDEAARMLFATPTVSAMDDFAVYTVARFDALSPADHKRLYTDAATALANEKAIILNEQFLHEAEIAVRAFGLAGSIFTTPYLRDDSNIFDFVRRVTQHRASYLAYLRSLADPAVEPRVIRETAFAVAFFIAHELGHLVEGHDASFGAFIQPDAPLETSLAIATLKFAAHDRELAASGFTLSATDRGRPEIEAAARRVLERLPTRSVENQAIWFERESAADQTATKILVECLAVPPLDGESTPAYILAIRALFAVAVTSWHKDLLVFIEELAGADAPPGAQALSLAMAQDRRQYIRASSLFGEVHRFTLLRATLAIEQILRPHQGPGDKPPVHWDAVCRDTLLRVLMDTAVKLAHVGRTTGWMLERDKERGAPQMFMMSFYNLGEELARLSRKLGRE